MIKKNTRLTSLNFVCKVISTVTERETTIENFEIKNLDWLTIIEITNEHFLTASLYYMLKDKDLLKYIDDEKLLAYLEHIYQINLQRNLQILDQSKELVQILGTENIKPLFLKGVASLFLKSYKDPGIRFLTDIDFYVNKTNIKQTLNLLSLAGYTPDKKCTYDYNKYHHHYTPMYSPKWHTFIEPHIAILNHNRTVINCNEKNYYSSPYNKGIYTLSHTDRFIHAYLHTDFDHKYYWKRELDLRQLYEIAILITEYNNEIDWKYIEKLINQLGIWQPFNDQMNYIHKLFNVSIPISETTLRSHFYTISFNIKFKYKNNIYINAIENKVYTIIRFFYRWLKNNGT